MECSSLEMVKVAIRINVLLFLVKKLKMMIFSFPGKRFRECPPKRFQSVWTKDAK